MVRLVCLQISDILSTGCVRRRQRYHRAMFHRLQGGFQDIFSILQQSCLRICFNNPLIQQAKAMQQIYQLLENPSARSFIKVCFQTARILTTMLQTCQLNSKSDLSLEAYILSVVQRICKYPLLLKVRPSPSSSSSRFKAAMRLIAKTLKMKLSKGRVCVCMHV